MMVITMMVMMMMVMMVMVDDGYGDDDEDGGDDGDGDDNDPFKKCHCHPIQKVPKLSVRVTVEKIFSASDLPPLAVSRQ